MFGYEVRSETLKTPGDGRSRHGIYSAYKKRRFTLIEAVIIGGSLPSSVHDGPENVVGECIDPENENPVTLDCFTVFWRETIPAEEVQASVWPIKKTTYTFGWDWSVAWLSVDFGDQAQGTLDISVVAQEADQGSRESSFERDLATKAVCLI